MKLSRLFFRFFWSIVFGLSTNVMHGQFLNTTLPDQVSGTTGSSSGVKNTGTDTWIEDAGQFGEHCPPNTSMCDDKNRWQVDVFDGPKGMFTWSFKGSGTLLDGTGSGYTKGERSLKILGYSEICDPDVVIARSQEDGELWAMIVGISDPEGSGVGRIQVTTLIWDNSLKEFTPKGSCGEDHFYVGATWPSQLPSHENLSGISLGRTCKSPNIDANSAGRVSLVWHEEEPIRVAIKWDWPFNEIQYVEVQRGNAFSLNGFINGKDTEQKFCMCKGNCKDLGIFRTYFDGVTRNIVDLFYPTTPGGSLVPSHPTALDIKYKDFCGGVPIGIPYEKAEIAKLVTFVNPDVCISEPYEKEGDVMDLVTYTFYRSGFRPNGYEFGPNGMVVTQDLWNNCYWDNRSRLGPLSGSIYPVQYSSSGTTYFRKENFGNLLLGQSRIAAPGFANDQNWKDFTLVQGSNGGYCDSDLGDVIRSYVRVWGRRGDEVTDDGVDINLGSNEFEFQNGGPVVSHWSNSSHLFDRFFVSWTANFLTNGNKTDVVVKPYELSISGTSGPGGGVGSLVLYAPSGSYPGYNANYSFVNNGTGDFQSISSISSRHFGDLMGSLFWSNNYSGTQAALQKWSCYSSVAETSAGLSLDCYVSGGQGGDRPGKGSKTNEGDSDVRFEKKATVQPNPSTSEFSVKINLEKDEVLQEVSIFDTQGKKVDSFDTPTFTWTPKNGFSKTMYSMRIRTNRSLFVKKVVLE